MARERDDGPRPLSDSLRRLASQVARVDLLGFAGVEAAWLGAQIRPRHRIAAKELPILPDCGRLAIAITESSNSNAQPALCVCLPVDGPDVLKGIR